MMQKIDREYVLTVDEVKEALWDYLKKQDRPAPPTPGDLDFSWNGPGEAFVKYHQVLQFNT